MKYVLFFVLPLILCTTFLVPPSRAQQKASITIARIKYRGGGDWYNDPSSLKNMIDFINARAPISINPEYDDVAVGSPQLFNYPFAFLTGHGNIRFNEAEASNLRSYLEHGGFLYVDDDYGLDAYFRKALKKVFPDKKLIELPDDHPIYHQLYDFKDGLPKIHEHDGRPAQGFALFLKGRMVLYYTYESNLADGWADPQIHKDPAKLRQAALRMGANLLIYALTSEL